MYWPQPAQSKMSCSPIQTINRQSLLSSDGHSPHTKAKALAMLMLGDSPRYVAQQTGVPLTTVERWRNKDVREWLREIFGPDFKRSIRMALKKET